MSHPFTEEGRRCKSPAPQCYKPRYAYSSEFTSIRAEILLKALWVDRIGYVGSETNMDSSKSDVGLTVHRNSLWIRKTN